MRLDELAQKIGAELKIEVPEQRSLEITGVAPIDQAKAGTISFIASPDYAVYAKDSEASALIVKEPLPDCAIPQLLHRNPYLAFAKSSQQFFEVDHGFHGQSTQAHCDPSADIASDAVLFPFVYVGPEAKIESGAVLYPGVYVGAKAVIGRDTVIHANCAIGERCQIGHRVLMHAGTVIGADGFGFAKDETEIVKIPQVGIVVIEDDCELGGCCTVDRATMGETRIRRDTKLDSKVHIGHNVEIGEHGVISALSGVAGSTKIGDWVTVGGHSGFSGHLKIGDYITVGAKTGVVTDLAKKGVYMGFPAVPANQWRRSQVYVKRLPDYEKRIRQLEKQIQELSAKLDENTST